MNMQKFAQALRILADAIDEAPATAGPDVTPVNETGKRGRPRKTEAAPVEVTPQAVEVTPQAVEVTPQAVEVTPQDDQPEPETVTQLEVRQALIALAKRTNNPEAPLSVLAKHGARNVSELSPNVFAAVVRECAA